MTAQKFKVGEAVIVSEHWSHHFEDGTVGIVIQTHFGGFNENYLIEHATDGGFTQAITGDLITKLEG